MRKLLLLTSITAASGFSYGQQITIKPNASLMIKAKTGFSFDALTLTPSTDLFLHGQTIVNDTTVSDTLNSTYVPNTFLFTDTFTYSGDIKIKYLEGQLNGIPENSLQLGVYNGNGWQNAGTTLVNTTDNYVLTSGINALPMGQLVLTTNIPLSMNWGAAAALRQGAVVRINWTTFAEKNVDHFDIFRSNDGINWTMAIAGIRAMNKPERCDYTKLDAPSSNGKLYYRIRQADAEGRFSFSKTLTVAAVHMNAPVMISPNPAKHYFMVSGTTDVNTVDLRNVTGTLVRSWSGNAGQYSLPALAAGTYYVTVKLRNGEISQHTLVIK